MTPFVDDPDFRLFVGDVRDVLRELPGELRARLLAGVTVSGDPFPKDKQLARGVPRYHRKVASKKRWQAIIDAKMEPCRICKHDYRGGNGGFKALHAILDPHHLIDRSDSGDDTENNIVLLCRPHHELVTRGDRMARASLGAALTSSERGYVLRKVGPDGFARLFGVPA